MEEKRRKTERKAAIQTKPINHETKSIHFVPLTNHGELARRLRKEEETLATLTGYKVKVVERSVMMVKITVHKSNSWAGDDCNVDDCPICGQGTEERAGDCKRRNLLYKTTCLE